MGAIATGGMACHLVGLHYLGHLVGKPIGVHSQDPSCAIVTLWPPLRRHRRCSQPGPPFFCPLLLNASLTSARCIRRQHIGCCQRSRTSWWIRRRSIGRSTWRSDRRGPSSTRSEVRLAERPWSSPGARRSRAVDYRATPRRAPDPVLGELRGGVAGGWRPLQQVYGRLGETLHAPMAGRHPWRQLRGCS